MRVRGIERSVCYASSERFQKSRFAGRQCGECGKKGIKQDGGLCRQQPINIQRSGRSQAAMAKMTTD